MLAKVPGFRPIPSVQVPSRTQNLSKESKESKERVKPFKGFLDMKTDILEKIALGQNLYTIMNDSEIKYETKKPICGARIDKCVPRFDLGQADDSVNIMPELQKQKKTPLICVDSRFDQEIKNHEAAILVWRLGNGDLCGFFMKFDSEQNYQIKEAYPVFLNDGEVKKHTFFSFRSVKEDADEFDCEDAKKFDLIAMTDFNYSIRFSVFNNFTDKNVLKIYIDDINLRSLSMKDCCQVFANSNIPESEKICFLFDLAIWSKDSKALKLGSDTPKIKMFLKKLSQPKDSTIVIGFSPLIIDTKIRAVSNESGDFDNENKARLAILVDANPPSYYEALNYLPQKPKKTSF